MQAAVLPALGLNPTPDELSWRGRPAEQGLARRHLPARRRVHEARPAAALSAAAERSGPLQPEPAACAVRRRTTGPRMGARLPRLLRSGWIDDHSFEHVIDAAPGRRPLAWPDRRSLPRLARVVPRPPRIAGRGPSPRRPARRRRRGRPRRGRRPRPRNDRVRSLAQLPLLDRRQPLAATRPLPRRRGPRHRMADDQRAGATEGLGLPRAGRHVGRLPSRTRCAARRTTETTTKSWRTSTRSTTSTTHSR